MQLRKHKQFIFYVLFALGIVAADQWTKCLVVGHISLYGYVKAIPGLFHWTYVQNTGAAFCSFSGMRWLFVLIFLLLTVGIAYEYFKKPMPFTQFERWCIASVYAGGLGNIIDRVRVGYVVDMVEVEFMDFAVFNLADCFICVGAVALMISLVFFNKKFWKEDKKK